MSYQIGGLFRTISNKMRRKAENLSSIKKLDELSGTNGYIIGFISRYEFPVYQKDIENEFGITRSTASKVLTLMEKKDLIVRSSVSNDARLKQIILTPKAKLLHSNMIIELDEFERQLLKDFNDSDKAKLLELLTRIDNNLEGGI